MNPPPQLLGVLNVTPDSFSDGGRYLDVEAAVHHGLKLFAEGAGRIDVGGESTRPGAVPVPPIEEQRRVEPVVRALVAAGVPVSVDTRHAAVAEAALDAGADWVNDVSGGADPAMFPLVVSRRATMVLMHMRGTPSDMAQHAVYGDVVVEVWAELGARVLAAQEAGLDPARLILDPGIGFAKTFAHNLALLQDLPARCASLAPTPLLLGVSRKSVVGHLTGTTDPQDRLPGSLALAIWARTAGVAWLRVHDVAATRAALLAWEAVACPAAAGGRV